MRGAGCARLQFPIRTSTHPWWIGPTLSTALWYIHAANRPWVIRPHASIHYWEGETMELHGGMTLVRCGAHFPGSAILHHDRDGGEIFTGDTFHVNPDR